MQMLGIASSPWIRAALVQFVPLFASSGEVAYVDDKLREGLFKFAMVA